MPRRILIVKGRTVRAAYRHTGIPDYDGNPLIEALPPVLTDDQAMLRLARYPQYDEAQRRAPDHIRYHLIQNGLRCFIPLDIHLDLQRRFSCLIRIGYAGRNPLAANFWQQLADKFETFDQYGDQYQALDEASKAAGFNIVGISGVGKSHSVERILNLYPQVIHHGQYRDRSFINSQVVWVKLDCPFDGSAKGLCVNFFQALDDMLGTNYRRNYAHGRRTTDEMLPDMALVAANHFLGVLVIDEIQRLRAAHSGGAERMLNFFVQLVNTIGVPVVLIGNYKALSVLSGDFSQMRRGTGQGDLVWERMAKDEQWHFFVESLWRLQYTRQVGRLEDDPSLADVLYEETQGITDLAVKAYMFAQARAIDSGRESIIASVIRSAARDKLGIPRTVLDALKTNDRRVLEQYEDVYPLQLKQHLSALPQAPEAVGQLDADIVNQPLVEEPLSAAPAEQPDTRHELIPAPAPMPEPPTNKGRGELPQIIASLSGQNDFAAYDALRLAGYIRHPNEYLPDAYDLKEVAP
ncbi:MAG: ATP-binding protein [Pyrinomonadaceae bacterium MAG19_C2-C3]|nr:ATP-binding protein [Pyrinomonadaceae bacterium MAG19_C2-C3]